MTNLNERIGITKLCQNVIVHFALKYKILWMQNGYILHIWELLANTLPAHSEIKQSVILCSIKVFSQEFQSAKL